MTQTLLDMFTLDCAFVVPAFFSDWEAEEVVYGKKAMAGQGISLWRILWLSSTFKPSSPYYCL